MRWRVLLCVWLVGPLMAQTPLAKQFEELRTAREAAMQEQDKQYLAKLKVLHARAEKASDMEAKALLNTEIAKLEASTVAPATAGGVVPDKIATADDLGAVLVAAKNCEWLKHDGSVFDRFQFLPGGKLKVPGSMNWLTKWEPVSKDEFRIYHQDGFYWLFEFSRDAGFAKSVKKRGAAQDETKAIRLLYKMSP
ncbi:hypothetical protein [Luteolibacter soli]|uniref:Uncharacterized protein n=1 Tax=Luteolibacter soli TaxID=3135280 RepID=A0ABU9ASK9_9BACT